jgi:hypothetical protein
VCPADTIKKIKASSLRIFLITVSPIWCLIKVIFIREVCVVVTRTRLYQFHLGQIAHNTGQALLIKKGLCLTGLSSTNPPKNSFDMIINAIIVAQSHHVNHFYPAFSLPGTWLHSGKLFLTLTLLRIPVLTHFDIKKRRRPCN